MTKEDKPATEDSEDRVHLLPEGIFASTIESFSPRKSRIASYVSLKLSEGGFVLLLGEAQLTTLCTQLARRGMHVQFPQDGAALDILLRKLIANSVPLAFRRRHRKVEASGSQHPMVLADITIL